MNSVSVAVVTDSTSYLPRRCLTGGHPGRPLRGLGRGSAARAEYEDLDAFYARLRESPELPVTSQPSVGDFLACFEPLAAAGRDIVSVHIAGGPVGHLRERARGRSGRRRAASRACARSSTARPGRGGSAASSSPRRARPRQGADLDAVVAAVRRARREARHLVLPRHARVSAAGRAHRRRAGAGRIGAEDQADPDLRHRDHPGRPRPHPPARLRAHGRLPARAARPRRHGLDRAARAVPRGRRALVAEGSAIFGSSRCSAPRSGRCSAPTSARACWSAAWGAAGPFRIDVPEVALDDLRGGCGARAGRRPRRSTTGRRACRWPTCGTCARTGPTSTTGAATEARLNALPQFRTEIDGLGIHFLHVRSPRPGRAAAGADARLAGLGRRVPEGDRAAGRPGAHGGDAPTRSTWCARRCPATGSATSRPAPGWGVERIARGVGRADGAARLRPLRRAGRRLGHERQHADRRAGPRARRRDPPACRRSRRRTRRRSTT